MSVLLAESVRSGYVESTHCGSVLALREDGSQALSLGAVERPWFPRSSNKPLQVVGLLDAGWVPRSSEQVALASASHSGEPGHVDVLRGMLPDLSLLRCPPELPLDEDAARAVLRSGGGPDRATMNCSGKHAAMVATCLAQGWDPSSYLSPDHPVQRAARAGVEALAGEQVSHVAVDGCGAPQHALTLAGLARAYLRLVAEEGAPRTVADAMRAHPWLVAGSQGDDTLLMQGLPGLLTKIGAEGVYAAAVPGVGAVALKVADGAARARTPVLVAALRALGVDAPVLEQLATTPVLGGGLPVGEVRAAGELARVGG